MKEKQRREGFTNIGVLLLFAGIWLIGGIIFYIKNGDLTTYDEYGDAGNIFYTFGLYVSIIIMCFLVAAIRSYWVFACIMATLGIAGYINHEGLGIFCLVSLLIVTFLSTLPIGMKNPIIGYAKLSRIAREEVYKFLGKNDD